MSKEQIVTAALFFLVVVIILGFDALLLYKAFSGS